MFWILAPWCIAAIFAAATVTYLIRGLLGERVSLKRTGNTKPNFGPSLTLLCLAACLAGLTTLAAWIALQVDYNLGGGAIVPIHGGALGATLFAIALSVWAAIGDRAKGRRRCPKCWHDLAEIESLANAGKISELRCPECGFLPQSPRQLAKPRRPRWATLTAAGMLFAALFIGANARNITNYGWRGALPTTVLLLGWRHLPEEWITGSRNHGSLVERLADDTQLEPLARIRFKFIQRSVIDVLFKTDDFKTAQRMAEISNELYWISDFDVPADASEITSPFPAQAVRMLIEDPESESLDDLLQVANAIASRADETSSEPIVKLSGEDAALFADQVLKHAPSRIHIVMAVVLAGWDQPEAIDRYLETNLVSTQTIGPGRAAGHALRIAAMRNESVRERIESVQHHPDPYVRLNALKTLRGTLQFDGHVRESLTQEEYIALAEAFETEHANITERILEIADEIPLSPEPDQQQIDLFWEIYSETLFGPDELSLQAAHLAATWIEANDLLDAKLVRESPWPYDQLPEIVEIFLNVSDHLDPAGVQALTRRLIDEASQHAESRALLLGKHRNKIETIRKTTKNAEIQSEIDQLIDKK